MSEQAEEQDPHNKPTQEADGQLPTGEATDPLAAAEAQVADMQEQLLRVRAESENLRKRLEREAASAVRYAAEKVFADLLAVADSLELGLKSARDAGGSEALIQGLELTQKQLLSVLDKHGVAVVDPVGEAFDPGAHEAMSMVPSADAPPNHVLNVVQKGYRLHERLLRPAMVIVASAPPEG